MSFEAIVDDGRRTREGRHPMIAIAQLEPKAQVSYKAKGLNSKTESNIWDMSS